MMTVILVIAAFLLLVVLVKKQVIVEVCMPYKDCVRRLVYILYRDNRRQFYHHPHRHFEEKLIVNLFLNLFLPHRYIIANNY